MTGFRSSKTARPARCAFAAALAALLAFGTPPAVAEEEPRLIKDVNARQVLRNSLCGEPVVVGGTAFFCGADNQLWMTDGTEDGTRPVRQENGLIVQYPSDLTSAGRWLYFTVRDELWRTDGTASNTMKLVDDQGRSIDPDLMTNVDDDLYFFRFNIGLSFLHELWRTDGTVDGTRQVHAFDPRLNPNDAVAINGELYFTNYTHQLWKSDGTSEGTVLLKDIDGFNYSDDHNNLTNVDGVLFFSMENANDQRDLWKSDGTPDGTVLVEENVSGRYFPVGYFTNIDGTLFFTAESEYTDTVIWKSDGTGDGTVPVITLPDVRVQAAGSLRNLYLLGTRDGGLWRSNGWAGGTFQLSTDFAPGTRPSLTEHQGLMYFAAENGTGLGEELWATDGTQAGTRLVRDIHWGHWPASPDYIASMDAGLIFQANRGRKFGGPALWISDGTEGGTRQVRDINRTTPGSHPSMGTVVGDQLYFVANIAGSPAWSSEWELWRTDGSRDGTNRVLDLIDEAASPGQFYRNEFAELQARNGTLYLSGRDGSGWGLWRKRPSSAFERLAGVVPVQPSHAITGLTVFHDDLYFFSDTWSSRGLWRLRPGADAAELVQDDLTNPRDIAVAQNRLVFLSGGDEMWLSDGSWGGTRKIKSLALGPDATVDRVQDFGGRFLFRVRWGFDQWGYTNRTALYVSDFTASGTRKLRRPYPPDMQVIDRGILYASGGQLWLSDGNTRGQPFADVPAIRGFIRAGGNTFFTGGRDESLWKTDGTRAGTVQVAGGFNVMAMGEMNGELYFTAMDPDEGGTSLYKSDGTGAGTVVIEPGLFSFRTLDSSPNRFLAYREDEPTQIWETDGTPAGTRQLSTFQHSSAIGSFFQEPYEFRLGRTLVLVVDDGIHGPELWAVDPPGDSGSGVMGDRVWLDADEDGVQDEDERGLADVAVNLEQCTGEVVATTRSDTEGHFTFDDVAPGDYRLRFEAPYGHVFSPAVAAGDYRKDSDADAADGTTWCASLSAGQKRLAIDAGFIRLQRAMLGDRVWNDLDGDGVQDPGEPGFSGVDVHLETCEGRWLRTERTAGDGSFVFDYVPDGEYRLRFYAPDGYGFSPKNATDDYRIDSNAHPVTGLDSCRTVRGGQQRLALDAGLVSER